MAHLRNVNPPGHQFCIPSAGADVRLAPVGRRARAGPRRSWIPAAGIASASEAVCEETGDTDCFAARTRSVSAELPGRRRSQTGPSGARRSRRRPISRSWPEMPSCRQAESPGPLVPANLASHCVNRPIIVAGTRGCSSSNATGYDAALGMADAYRRALPFCAGHQGATGYRGSPNDGPRVCSDAGSLREIWRG